MSRVTDAMMRMQHAQEQHASQVRDSEWTTTAEITTQHCVVSARHFELEVRPMMHPISAFDPSIPYPGW